MVTDNLPDDDAGLLARLLDLGSDEQGVWEAGELASMFEHQWNSPIAFPRVEPGGKSPGAVHDLCQAVEPPIETFGDLFEHPRPPVELLRMTKDFAKSCRGASEHFLPAEIATALYALSIARALLSHQQRISALNDQGLRHVLSWALEQPWLGQPARRLLNSVLLDTGKEGTLKNA